MIKRTEPALLHLGLVLAAGARVLQKRIDHDDHERGDVPGWVMITLMSAIVVIGLLAVFRAEVFNAVSAAFKSIN